MFWQGAAKVDWVTVWFLLWNWKAMTSPTEALRLVGLKVRLLLPPTMTVYVVCADTAPTETRAAKTVEKRISNERGNKQIDLKVDYNRNRDLLVNEGWWGVTTR